MIKNERQYRITKAMAARFQNNLTDLKQRPDADGGVHPLIAKAREEALTSQLADLENELHEYESLKAGKFRLDSLKVVADLPSVLIKARIAQGLSQKELAERIGLKPAGPVSAGGAGGSVSGHCGLANGRVRGG